MADEREMADSESVADVVERVFPGASSPSKDKLVRRFTDEFLVATAGDLKRLKHGLPKSVVERLVEEGMFVSEELEQEFARGAKVVQACKDYPSVDFGNIQAFKDVPWPCLSSLPPRFAGSRASGFTVVDAVVGREGFDPLLKTFVELEDLKRMSRALEGDGTVGCGKSHLVLLVAVRCTHDFALDAGKRKRLVYVPSVVPNEKITFIYVKEALILAFWDDRKAQRKISVAEDWEAIESLVQKLGKANNMYYIFDDWNKLEENPVLRDRLEAMTLHRPCIYCGSARQQATQARLSSLNQRNIPYNFSQAFNAAELAVYLDDLEVDQALTGNVALYVRLYKECLVGSEGSKENAMQMFHDTNEVRIMKTEIPRMALKALHMDSGTRKTRIEALMRIVSGRGTQADLLDTDTRWMIFHTKKNKVAMVSQLASDILVTSMNRFLPDADNAVVQDRLAFQILEECKSTFPNPSLLGWLAERLVIGVGCKHAIGNEEEVVIEQVDYFEEKPATTLSRRLADNKLRGVFSVPWLYRYPHIHSVLHYINRHQLLSVHLYQVSLALQSGSDHWKSASKFFEPENYGKFTEGDNPARMKWSFTWIGRSCDKPDWAPSRTNDRDAVPLVFLEQYICFEDLATKFGSQLSRSCVDALNALSVVENQTFI